MPNLAPIDYGSAVAADTSGAREAQGVVGENAARAKQQLSQVGRDCGADGWRNGPGHPEEPGPAATADAKETQSQTLDFIESHPYISKEDLRSRMSAEDYESWHASLDPDDKQRDAVPMYKAGWALFESVAKKSREQTTRSTSRRRWRGSDWTETDRSETELQGRPAQSGDGRADGPRPARRGQGELGQIARQRQGRQGLRPGHRGDARQFVPVTGREKMSWTQNALQMKDRGPSMRRWRARRDGMREELTKLENPDTSKQFFPHTNDEAAPASPDAVAQHINHRRVDARPATTWKRSAASSRMTGPWGAGPRLVQGEDPSELLRAVKTRSYEDRGDASSTSFAEWLLRDAPDDGGAITCSGPPSRTRRTDRRPTRPAPCVPSRRCTPTPATCTGTSSGRRC
jgi:hypothetical protein